MADLGWTPVKLPSRGALYPDPEDGGSLIPDGEVQIRKLTTKEESTMLSQGAGGIERLSIVVNRCTQLPESFTKAGFTHDDLLMTDRMALMLALRTITFGANYSFTYRCRECGEQNKKDIDIMEELDEQTPDNVVRRLRKKGREIPEDYILAEPIEVQLKDAEVTVGLRFLRGKDETRISKYAKRMRLQSNDMDDDSYTYRLALQIVSIDGNDTPSITEAQDFVERLTAADSARIRIATDDVEPGIDLRIYPECRACGAMSELGLPFTAEFFRPTTL